jgi:acyl-CoA reductase-like NAD-dependent aldehyde dehydrogenase
VTWTDDDELVRMVNDTEFGLVAYICARDLKRASSWPN